MQAVKLSCKVVAGRRARNHARWLVEAGEVAYEHRMEMRLDVPFWRDCVLLEQRYGYARSCEHLPQRRDGQRCDWRAGEFWVLESALLPALVTGADQRVRRVVTSMLQSRPLKSFSASAAVVVCTSAPGSLVDGRLAAAAILAAE